MKNGKWYNSLRVQIVLLLSLALFPLGAIAIHQTTRVAAEADRSRDLAILALTKRAARADETVIARAVGSSQVLSTLAQDTLIDPETCERHLENFMGDHAGYDFVGILPATGVLACSSQGGPYDLSDWPIFARMMSTQERTIFVNRQTPMGGDTAYIVSEPYEIDGAFAGFVILSISRAAVLDTETDLADLGLLQLITLDDRGDTLVALQGQDGASGELPEEPILDGLINQSEGAIHATNRNGVERIYTVVRIEGSPAKVIGIWEVHESSSTLFDDIVQPALFPVLMWIASMAVAILSIYMLVLRHITRMRRDMENFEEHRIIASPSKTPTMPNELQALERNFGQMTASILREEAEMEDLLREKNVLIKEVHHRVKNNLQLISSIMNMKIRIAKHEETRSMLSRLQDRILSLATIHRDLYQSQNGGLVNAGTLLSEIIEKSAEVAAYSDDALSVETDFDPVWLYPDQIVPLSLLAAEGMTNAMKYTGEANDGSGWVKVSLKQTETECVLTMANSIGDTSEAESTGLGTQLINAFSIQLGGQIEQEKTETSYKLTLRFTIEDFVPEGRDF